MVIMFRTSRTFAPSFSRRLATSLQHEMISGDIPSHAYSLGSPIRIFFTIPSSEGIESVVGIWTLVESELSKPLITSTKKI